MSNFFWYFMIYSFLGFLLELAFARFSHSQKQHRKCFFLLPLCPVYGFGAVLILALPAPIRQQPVLLMLLGCTAATLTEYLLGTFYERVLRVSFWDYSALPFNIGGRVCLPFSLVWSILSVVLVDWLHPWVILLASAIPSLPTAAALSLTLGDAGVSCHLLRRFRTTAALCWYQPFPAAADIDQGQ